MSARLGLTVGDVLRDKERRIQSAALRPLFIIGREVCQDWRKVSSSAEPYLAAMLALDKITDDYFADSAKDVVLYFLSNATGWRGSTARRVKAELRAML